jgi:hypothetical protein
MAGTVHLSAVRRVFTVAQAVADGLANADVRNEVLFECQPQLPQIFVATIKLLNATRVFVSENLRYIAGSFFPSVALFYAAVYLPMIT